MNCKRCEDKGIKTKATGFFQGKRVCTHCFKMLMNQRSRTNKTNNRRKLRGMA